VTEALQESAPPSLDNAVRDYAAKRVRYERLQAQADAAKAAMTEAQNNLWDLFEAEDVKTINHALGRFTRSAPMIAVIKDGEALMGELDMLGLRGTHTAIKFVQANINGLLRERVENGEDPPSGTEPFVQHRMTWAGRPDQLRIENWNGEEEITLG
jgi:hypothetical protein